jgi:hypothetical protein
MLLRIRRDVAVGDQALTRRYRAHVDPLFELVAMRVVRILNRLIHATDVSVQRLPDSRQGAGAASRSLPLRGHIYHMLGML